MRVPTHPITIQKMNEHEQWEDYFHCRAGVNDLHGSEYYAARAVGEEETTVFIVRYCEALSAVASGTFRILFRRNAYEIQSVDNLHYNNRTLKIKGVCRRAGACR